MAVIEDSILEVLKQANKPRVYFLNVLKNFCIISIYKLTSWHELLPLLSYNNSVIEKCFDYLNLPFFTQVLHCCRQFCFCRLFY